MPYEGDIRVGAVLEFDFNTVNTSSVPTTLAGTPSLAVYKNSSTTESTAGITLTVDHDSVTGRHHVKIDTSADGTFYAAANEFSVVSPPARWEERALLGPGWPDSRLRIVGH